MSSEICQIISLGFKQRCRMCSETEAKLLTRNTTLQSFTSIEILMSHLSLREDNLISIIPRDAQLRHKGTQWNTFWGRVKKKEKRKGKSSAMHAGCARLCTHLEHQPKINLRIPREQNSTSQSANSRKITGRAQWEISEGEKRILPNTRHQS